MNLDFLKYHFGETINGENALEVIAKINNPSYKKTNRFFIAPNGKNIDDSQICGDSLIPIDTDEGFAFFSQSSTPIPFELYDDWIKTHPNQRFLNCETLKSVVDNGFVTQEFLNDIKEIIVEVPEEYRNLML